MSRGTERAVAEHDLLHVREEAERVLGLLRARYADPTEGRAVVSTIVSAADALAALVDEFPAKPKKVNLYPFLVLLDLARILGDLLAEHDPSLRAVDEP